MGLTALSLDDVATELEYRLCEQRGGLRTFCKASWSIIEPATPLSWSWFHDAICDHLEAVSYGDIHDLLINIPPRHAKSTFVAIMWPCWEWGPAGMPHLRAIFSSYAQSLSQRDSQRRRLLMDTSWYRSGWGHVFSLGRQKWLSDGQIKYVNDKLGYHLSTSVGGSNTGEGGDRIIADDPHNMNEIHSETVREGALTWWDEVMSTRLNDQRTGARVIIMQRGHERDLAGHAIEQGGYVHLNLQAEFDPRRRCFTKTDDGRTLFIDPRTMPGELLFPERFPREVIERLKIRLGPAYEAQFQQNPTPDEGGILKRAWWRYWAPDTSDLVGTLDPNGNPILPVPRKFQYLLNSWDCAFKDEEDSSYVVGQSWGALNGRAYCLGQFREHADFIATIDAVQMLRRCHRQLPNAVYIEDKANGTAIIRTLRDSVPGVLPSDVGNDSKPARAHAAAPRLKAGNYVLPHPSLPGCSWVAGDNVEAWISGTPAAQSFLHETSMFPNSAYDDQVDAFTQADRHLFMIDMFSEENFGDAEVGIVDMGL